MTTRTGLMLAAVLAAAASHAGDLEQRLMDNLLDGIGDPSLTREVRILTRLDRLYIESRTPPAFEAGDQPLFLMAQPWPQPVLYTTRPDPEAPPPEAFAAACPGESEPFTFALYPARDLVVRHVEVTAPACKDREVPRQALTLYRERHIFVAPRKDMRAFRPFALESVNDDLPLLSNVTTRFWIDINVPSDTPAGTYTGRVDVLTDGARLSLPYALEVYPFTLAKPRPAEMAWGFWFPPPRDPELLRRHLQLMQACGITTFAFENWEARTDAQGQVTIDTGELDAVLDAAESAGLTGPFVIGIGLGEFPGSGPEYSPEWQTRYQQAIRLFHEHMTRRGTPYAGIVFDEPRESNIRPCNRNREQMLRYLDLINEAAPDLRTMVNPMSDETSPEHPGGFYTDFAERFDIVMPHFWARATNLINRARQHGGAELWSYNDGPNRLGWGLHSWANGLHGRMQYAWLLTGPKDHPYSPVQRGSFEYAGLHPGSQLWAVELGGKLRPTPRLLGIREGIDDYRYLYTLERRLDQAAAGALKDEASAWLDHVRREVPAYAHAADFVDETAAGDGDADALFLEQLDARRSKAADFIRRLSTP